MSSLPLWIDGLPPPEHRSLEGRHLSDLRDMNVIIQGPTMVVPRRLVSMPDRTVSTTPIRSRPGAALAAIAAHGGGLDVVVDRARKLASHRVPLIICGEQGLEREAFARALVEDVLPNLPGLPCIDAARSGGMGDLRAALAQLRFLCEYPVDRIPPVLVVLNVDRLDPDPLRDLQDFLDELEREHRSQLQMAQRPLLLMTLQADWTEIRGDGANAGALRFLVGQSAVTLPPLRKRNLGQVLDAVLAADFAGGLELSEAARARLCAYDWPGNLREMRAVLREAAICGNGQRINLVDLPARLESVAPVVVAPDSRQALLEALDSTGWNVTRAAARLGKSRATVNRWIADFGLQRPK